MKAPSPSSTPQRTAADPSATPSLPPQENISKATPVEPPNSSSATSTESTYKLPRAEWEKAQALASHLSQLDTRSMVAKRMRSWLTDAGYREGHRPTMMQ